MLRKCLFKAETEEGEDSSGEKPPKRNWMEEAEKQLQILKLREEKENGDEEEDDWDDFGDLSDEDNSSDDDSST